jgi:multiple antibiotic resistance protein
MRKFQRFLYEGEPRLRLLRRTQFVVSLAAGVSCLAAAGIASAADAAAGQLPVMHFQTAHVFTFLFLMLGPFKIIAPFSKLTKGADPALSRQIAVRAVVFSCLALLVAAVLGESFLSKYGIPLPILSLAAGIILFLVALQGIIQQFGEPTQAGGEVPAATPAQTLKLAMAPLAFPTIVTPYGIAAVVVFLALSPDMQGRLTIGAILLGIMLLNLVAMLMARRLPPVMGVALAILGAVLGVIQVALGLQIISNSLAAIMTA